MRGWIMAIGLALPGVALGEEAVWQPLSGAEIREALTERVLFYGEKRQSFLASGRTLYVAGQESWGYWEVRGNQYCSMWPPSDLWACYDMEGSATAVRFIGAAGDVTQGSYIRD